MKIDQKNNAILFESTGRKEYGYGGVVGIGSDGTVYTGWDDELSAMNFSQAERQELASYMIELWRAFRDEPDREINEAGLGDVLPAGAKIVEIVRGTVYWTKAEPETGIGEP
jgi:hypothetical protein